VMLTMIISTLIPLWGLAILANRSLNNSGDTDNKLNDNLNTTNKQKGQH
jgi:holin-like protein